MQRPVYVLFMAFSAAAAALAACGADEATTPAGADSGASSSSGGGAPGSSAARSLCQAVSAQLEACDFYGPLGEACSHALYTQASSPLGLDACAAGLGATYVPAYVDIQAACGAANLDCSCVRDTCTDAAAPERTRFYECLGDALRALEPTAAQRQLQKDFCETCPPSDASDDPCTTFLDVGVVGGASTAPEVLLLSDSSIAKVDAHCTGVAVLVDDAGEHLGCTARGFARCLGESLSSLPDGGDATSGLPGACRPDAAH